MDIHNWVWFAGILILAVLIDMFAMPPILAFLHQGKKPARVSFVKRMIAWMAFVRKTGWTNLKKAFQTGLKLFSSRMVALVGYFQVEVQRLKTLFSKKKTQTPLPGNPVKVDNPPTRKIIDQPAVEQVEQPPAAIIQSVVKNNPTPTRAHVEITVSLSAGQQVKISVESIGAQEDKKEIK